LEDCRISTTLTGIIIDKSLVSIEMRRYKKGTQEYISNYCCESNFRRESQTATTGAIFRETKWRRDHECGVQQ
jgi:hypothetical protein